jgi:hypothetical protein
MKPSLLKRLDKWTDNHPFGTMAIIAVLLVSVGILWVYNDSITVGMSAVLREFVKEAK